MGNADDTPAKRSANRGQETRFDIIVSNPPYIARDELETLARTVRDFEPRAALVGGDDGLDVIQRLIREAPQHLTAGGYLVLEVGYRQAASVRALFNEPSWSNVTTVRDFGGHERVVVARCVRPVFLSRH